MPLKECKIINLPKINDLRGNLTFIENLQHLPFDIKRIYYLYDIPADSERGEHAHKNLQQLIIAVSGSFEVLLNDGKAQQIFHLSKPWQGLYVCPMIWREIRNFSSSSVCLVLASEIYDENDYYRNFSEFMAAIKRE